MAKKWQLEETQKGEKLKFLKELTISNYGVFPYQKKEEDAFKITFNVPDGKTKGSGLTIIIGENACGKTTLLEALLQTKEQGDVPQFLKNVYARERPSSVRSNPSELSFRRFYSFKEKSNTLERSEGTQILYELQEAKAIELSDIIKKLGKRADENRVDRDLHYIDVFNVSRIRKDKLLGSEVVKQNLHFIRYAEMHDNDEPSDLFQMGEGILALRYLSGLLKYYMPKTRDTADEIFLIDEPEQHLHPEAITKLVELLCDIGKTCQIILTTHSLQIVEDILSSLRGRDNQKEPEKHFRILTKTNGKIILTDMSKCLLPYASANEINYVAFHRITAGYFNELYGCLNEELASREGKEYLQQEAMDDFFEKKGYKKDKKTEGRKTPETVFTYLRNAICHPENKKRSYQEKDLTENTEKLREIVKELKEESKNGEKAH